MFWAPFTWNNVSLSPTPLREKFNTAWKGQIKLNHINNKMNKSA